MTAEPDPDHSEPELVEGEEVLEGTPVLAEVRAVELPPASALPARQAAAAAATGFLAGAATLAYLQHRVRRLAAAAPGRPLGPAPHGARTYLVHVITRPLD